MAIGRGVTVDTFKHLLLDAGVVVRNYGLPDQEIMFATRGGNEITIEREVREMTADNLHGKVKGGSRIIAETARIVANALEVTTEMILAALPGAFVSTGSGDGEDIIESSGVIDLSDYIENVALVGKNSETGEDVIFLLKNALATSGLTVKMNDKDEAVIPITFEAHYDPADLDTVPWQIIKDPEAGSGS